MHGGRKNKREARRAKKGTEGKEMGTGGWEMPAGRKRAREAGVQKRRERAKRQGKEGEISLLRHIHSCTEVKNHGIIIAKAIIRAGRAVSEANKPLRGRVQPRGAISWPEAMV